VEVSQVKGQAEQLGRGCSPGLADCLVPLLSLPHQQEPDLVGAAEVSWGAWTSP